MNIELKEKIKDIVNYIFEKLNVSEKREGLSDYIFVVGILLADILAFSIIENKLDEEGVDLFLDMIRIKIYSSAEEIKKGLV